MTKQKDTQIKNKYDYLTNIDDIMILVRNQMDEAMQAIIDKGDINSKDYKMATEHFRIKSEVDQWTKNRRDKAMENPNIRELYNIIMNDEAMYELYMKGAFGSAIKEASKQSIIYGNPIKLISEEKQQLATILDDERYDEF